MSVPATILTWAVVLSMFSLMYLGAWGIRVAFADQPADPFERVLILVISMVVLVLSTAGMVSALGVLW